MAASDEQEGKEDFLILAAAKVFNVMIEGGAGELVLGVVRGTYGFKLSLLLRMTLTPVAVQMRQKRRGREPKADMKQEGRATHNG